MENLVIEMQNKLFICPYFREEGGGQEGYQNILIFDVLIRGEGGVLSKQGHCPYSCTFLGWLPLGVMNYVPSITPVIS